MEKCFKKGQSILEYTLILGAVIAVLVVALLGTSGQGGIKNKVGSAYDKAGNAISTTTSDLSHGIFE